MPTDPLTTSTTTTPQPPDAPTGDTPDAPTGDTPEEFDEAETRARYLEHGDRADILALIDHYRS